MVGSGRVGRVGVAPEPIVTAIHSRRSEPDEPWAHHPNAQDLPAPSRAFPTYPALPRPIPPHPPYTSSMRLVLLLLFLAACRSTESPKPAAADYGLAGWAPPSPDSIPNDSLGNSIRRGLAIMRHTRDSLPGYASSSLNCTSCHLEDGRRIQAAPLTGAFARYPKYMPRAGAVVPLADRVNYCFTRSLAGYRLPTESREMQDILSYLAWLSKGVPVGAKIAGTEGLLEAPKEVASDTARGRATFAAKCSACHGADGKGNSQMGAPDLTDELWLYGGDEATVETTVRNGRNGVMPAWGSRLDPETIKELAIYVHSLGGGR